MNTISHTHFYFSQVCVDGQTDPGGVEREATREFPQWLQVPVGAAQVYAVYGLRGPTDRPAHRVRGRVGRRLQPTTEASRQHR